jgi:O-antigen/teichoic acid export membrane protein
VTLLAVAAFAVAVALSLLAIGPWAMDLVFGEDYAYGRWGLAVVALGMGFHLAAGTLNQAALARGHAARAAVAWLAAAVLFVAWMVTPAIDDELLRAEVGYAAATALLCLALWRVYRAS